MDKKEKKETQTRNLFQLVLQVFVSFFFCSFKMLEIISKKKKLQKEREREVIFHAS